MNRWMKEYCLEILEDYESFVMMYDPYEDVMSIEAYAKARLNNDRERIIAEVVDMYERLEV